MSGGLLSELVDSTCMCANTQRRGEAAAGIIRTASKDKTRGRLPAVATWRLGKVAPPKRHPPPTDELPQRHGKVDAVG